MCLSKWRQLLVVSLRFFSFSFFLSSLFLLYIPFLYRRGIAPIRYPCIVKILEPLRTHSLCECMCVCACVRMRFVTVLAGDEKDLKDPRRIFRRHPFSLSKFNNFSRNCISSFIQQKFIQPVGKFSFGRFNFFSLAISISLFFLLLTAS